MQISPHLVVERVRAQQLGERVAFKKCSRNSCSPKPLRSELPRCKAALCAVFWIVGNRIRFCPGRYFDLRGLAEQVLGRSTERRTEANDRLDRLAFAFVLQRRTEKRNARSAGERACGAEQHKAAGKQLGDDLRRHVNGR